MKNNQPSLAECVVDQPWMHRRAQSVQRDRGHGRIEKRSTRVLPVSGDAPLPGFPSAKQMIMITRDRSNLKGEAISEQDVVFAITSLSRKDAPPRALAQILREHWHIENRLHYVRDVTYHEDLSRVRTGSGPRVMASMRKLAISAHRLCGEHRAGNARLLAETRERVQAPLRECAFGQRRRPLPNDDSGESIDGLSRSRDCAMR